METTMSDADLLADVPDTFDVSADADVLGGIDEEAQMEEAEERALEAAEEEAQRAAARERQRAAEAAEEAMLEEDEAAMLGEGDPTKPPRPPKLKSGKRPVIQHTLQAPAHASVPLTEEELARRVGWLRSRAVLFICVALQWIIQIFHLEELELLLLEILCNFHQYLRKELVIVIFVLKVLLGRKVN
jgi:hypothetical protein